MCIRWTAFQGRLLSPNTLRRSGPRIGAAVKSGNSLTCRQNSVIHANIMSFLYFAPGDLSDFISSYFSWGILVAGLKNLLFPALKSLSISFSSLKSQVSSSTSLPLVGFSLFIYHHPLTYHVFYSLLTICHKSRDFLNLFYSLLNSQSLEEYQKYSMCSVNNHFNLIRKCSH